MLTSLATWPSLSRWNRFPITYSWTDFVLEFDVTLVTRILSLNFLSEGRTNRLELIEKLYNDGLTDRQISEYLNDRGIKTPRNKEYYPELVFVTRRKMMLRNQRKSDKSWVLENVKIYIKR